MIISVIGFLFFRCIIKKCIIKSEYVDNNRKISNVKRKWGKEMLEIAICDDDKADLDCAVEMVREILKYNEIGYNLQFSVSAEEMLRKAKRIDIAILDISMKELNGIELGRALKIRFPEVKLVYITSYEEYYVQAINDAHAFSFLCKPLERDKLQKQLWDLIKELKYSNYTKEKTFYHVLDNNMQELPVVTLRLNDIIYFEYIKSMRKISIVLENQSYKCSYVMEDLIDELTCYYFATNCRGQLVNLRYVSKIKGLNVYLHNGEVLGLARRRSAEFRKSMNDFLHDNL